MLRYTGGKLSYFGAALYIAVAVQFVVCMVVTASHYGPPAYNPATNTISDLQAVSCGQFQGAQVCSPMHALANLSVAFLGLLIVGGSVSLRPFLPGGRRKDVAVALLVAAGLAAFANAFTPEDVTLTGDTVTAIIAFLAANFGLIQIGRSLPMDPPWGGYRLFTQALGVIGTAAFILDGLGLGTVIGAGVTEWLIVVPILIWTPATGIRVIILERSTS